ncbi:MAG TPA: SpoIIE family protein phosphatase [Candidatus Baltobacteraceae bacterium]
MEELTQSNAATEHLSSYIDLLPLPSAIAMNRACTQVRMNRAFTDLLGAPTARFRYMRDHSELRPDELPMWIAARTGNPVYDVPLDVVFEGGRTLHLSGSAAPIRDEEHNVCGAIAHFVDKTETRELVREQHSTQLALGVVREERRRSSDRLASLWEVGLRLSESLNVQSVMETLATTLVPNFADCVAISSFDAQGRMKLDLLRDSNRDREVLLRELRRRLRITAMVLPSSSGVLETERSFLTNDLRSLCDGAQGASHREYIERMIDDHGFVRGIVVPMRSRGQMTGAFTVLGCANRLYTEQDLHFLEEIGRRAASAIDNARSFERAYHAAQTLQQALLPGALPSVPGLTFDAVYAPADDVARIGGDWYDAFELPDGLVAISIGDVTGRGVEAAVIMGRVRQSIATIGLFEREPAKILDRADLALRRESPETMVTAFVGIFDLRRRMFTFASAGHPPPYMRATDGTICQLQVRGLPLGLRNQTAPESQSVALEAGMRFAFYTDGLTESTHNMVDGERRVLEELTLLSNANVPWSAQAIREAVLSTGSNDDVAILTVEVGHPSIGRG